MCNRQFKMGEVYLMNFTGEDSEQQGWRPGIVFQNNKGNAFSPNIIALPLTTSLKKLQQPTHIFIPGNQHTGLKRDSVVLCENMECISKNKIGAYLTTLPEEYISDIAIGSLLATAAMAYINPNKLFDVREKSLLLNNTVA